MSLIISVLIGIVFLVGLFTIGKPVFEAVLKVLITFGKVGLVVGIIGLICYFIYQVVN